MKTSRFIQGLAPLAAGALLLPAATSAQTSFTATGWANAVFAPGIATTNALGHVLLRGVVHTARVQGSDARVTGQVLILGDGAYNADGTANVQGPAYLQVGTWDAAGTNFTPGAGTWMLNWRGVMPTDFSLQLNLAGYGVGGAIDSQRVDATLTRGPASGPIDPNVPYLYAGTLKPAPINTSQPVDAFAGGQPPFVGTGAGSGSTVETNHQLTIRGDWTGIATINSMNTTAFAGWPLPWTVPDGQTVEVRADLVNLSPDALVLVTLFGTGSRGYAVVKASDWIGIVKQTGPAVIWFRADHATTKLTNVGVAMALTASGQNVLITAKVLDKDNAGAVLDQASAVDTPAADPSLSAADLAPFTDGQVVWGDVVPDAAGAPLTSGTAPFLMVSQVTDGTKPPTEATFANFELRTYEVPEVSIAKAVQLSWPAPAGVNYSVEGAPTVQGPWLPVQPLPIPEIQNLTVPLTGPAQFFRVVEAP